MEMPDSRETLSLNLIALLKLDMMRLQINNIAAGKQFGKLWFRASKYYDKYFNIQFIIVLIKKYQHRKKFVRKKIGSITQNRFCVNIIITEANNMSLVVQLTTIVPIKLSATIKLSH